MSVLTRIFPSIGNPPDAKRRTVYKVMLSTLLYGDYAVKTAAKSGVSLSNSIGGRASRHC